MFTQEVVISWNFYGIFLFVGVTACSAQGPKGAPMASGLSQYYWASSPSYSLLVVQVLLNGLHSWILEILLLSVLYLVRELLVLFIVLLFLLLKQYVLFLQEPLLSDDLLSLSLAEVDSHLYPSLLLIAFLSSK
jgi:hypothetical protein